MLKTRILLVAVLAACSAVHAQSTPAKQEIIGKILKIQQPGIESMARALVEQPAADLLDRAGPALQARVAPDKQEAVAKEIQGDARKYVEEALPLVRDRAIKLAPSTVGALLDEKFSEDELKQVLAMMQSPVYNKFQSLGGEMQKVLSEKVIADTRAVIEPKVRTLEQSMARRLGVTAAAPAASRPAAKK